jgi:CPA2 family monovalent cation:H+ antiporter-2
VRHARALFPRLIIIGRAHFDEEVDSLKADGATVVIMGEREIARGMVDSVLASGGAAVSPPAPSPAPSGAPAA